MSLLSRGPVRRSARLMTVSTMDVCITEPQFDTTPTFKRRISSVEKVGPDGYAIATSEAIIAPAPEEVCSPPVAKRQKRAAKAEEKGMAKDPDGLEHTETPTKPKRRKKEIVEPVYIIPEVEKKTTTYRGRLGYACLNTVMRNKKPASESVFCSRTCRIDSVKKNGIDFVKDLGRKNVQDLLTLIQWNEDNHIRFFRLSSEMFPFASHEKYGYSLDYCSDLLAQAGALANKYKHRLTTHPGQYTQLGSPKPNVVESSIRELAYHAEMLDLMGVGPDGVMIIHGGGVYGDKPTTLKRLKESIRNLPPNIFNRLVLENDEMCFNAEDLLPLCEELNVPLVFDYHHDNLFPSSIPPKEIIQRANAIWKKRGIRPKQHLSEQRPGAVTILERRAHSDRCENLPPDLPDDMDLMIEAKDKEQAVLHLHRMYGLQPVIQASLRPPNKNPTKQTQGRKSNKRAKAAKNSLDKQLEEADENPAGDFEEEPIVHGDEEDA
ncbi:hypothetical protein CVT24_003334 [Panaeolus cyanescens]|uniref:UV-endonuclease UvdE n=1 Tax=Panaeolus cyanescens TaxID=181874 RepID=A0A409Y6W1_9AGAR|nr:hypothetical protein CVT24_003334 [Panaeolus cyanescens]